MAALVPLPARETIPDAPIRDERTIGKLYLVDKRNVRIWQGNCWYCIHTKQVDKCVDCKSSTIPKQNLKQSHPQLESEWSSENGPMDTWSTSSNKKAKWVCIFSHSWMASPNSRTNCASKCPECCNQQRRVVDPELKEAAMNRTGRRTTTQTGDDSERFIENLLKQQTCFLNVERIGFTSDKADIVVQLKTGEKKSLQVKTLTLNKSDGSYFMTNDAVYASDMLIVMLNQERTCFAVNFAGKICVKRLGLQFAFAKSKYRDIMFTDKNAFVTRLIELIPLSTTMVPTNTESVNKEIAMFGRLQQFCEDHDLQFRRNDTNGDTMDAFIEGIPIQCKFSSLPLDSPTTYHISMKKSAGRVGKHAVKRPYSVLDEFQYVVVEVGGTVANKTLYLGQFCFIPISKLKEREVLTTDTCPGKTSIHVCAPDTKKTSHWSYKYWDNVEDFSKSDVEPNAKRPRLI